MESGYHSSLWFDLDPLFARPGLVMPFVERLTEALRPHGVAAVCGPLLGGAFLAQSVTLRLGTEF
jgi:orotate phosphoribosyltransferase